MLRVVARVEWKKEESLNVHRHFNIGGAKAVVEAFFLAVVRRHPNVARLASFSREEFKAIGIQADHSRPKSAMLQGIGRHRELRAAVKSTGSVELIVLAATFGRFFAAKFRVFD